jgi:hypothetical protein
MKKNINKKIRVKFDRKTKIMEDEYVKGKSKK